jgi:hypothetical protein
VAVIVLAPEAAAPTQALIALCSDSTGIVSVSTTPSATKRENAITISVWGVMGYAANTSGFIWRIAWATASFPVKANLSFIICPPLCSHIFRSSKASFA